MALTSAQRKQLKGLGHHREPVVQIGTRGVTPMVVKQVAAQLESHELIKVRVGQGSPAGRHEIASALAPEVEAELVQVLGRNIMLYKPHPKAPKIKLVAAKATSSPSASIQ